MKYSTVFRSCGALLGLILLMGLSPSFADQMEIDDYQDARELFWGKLYAKGGKSLYCRYDLRAEKGFNIEHVFAASWMKRAGDCGSNGRKTCRHHSARFNRMEADLHNLFPAKAKLNSDRGNLAYGIVSGRVTKPCDFEVGRGFAEPAPYARGEIARAILYMEHEYSADIDRDSNKRGLRDQLLKWHCEDPVSDEERARNDAIERLQGTRNRFIDNPHEINCSKI